MRNTFLEFEQPLAELENKIEQLRYVQADSAVDISDEIGRLQQKSQTLAKEIYAKLTPWQTALAATSAHALGQDTGRLEALRGDPAARGAGVDRDHAARAVRAVQAAIAHIDEGAQQRAAFGAQDIDDARDLVDDLGAGVASRGGHDRLQVLSAGRAAATAAADALRHEAR
ncbi:hypothetical protein G6F31_017269 [Rhizopus arrhizus]|nr:hypothetical protein G6F31_017269 [Rhizopus arrhizus]